MTVSSRTFDRDPAESSVPWNWGTYLRVVYKIIKVPFLSVSIRPLLGQKLTNMIYTCFTITGILKGFLDHDYHLFTILRENFIIVFVIMVVCTIMIRRLVVGIGIIIVVVRQLSKGILLLVHTFILFILILWVKNSSLKIFSNYTYYNFIYTYIFGYKFI